MVYLIVFERLFNYRETIFTKLNSKTITNVAIYATIALGPVLLLQVYGIVHAYLFYSLLTGWIIYLIAGAGVALNKRKFYILASLLSILVLVLSLTQPEHYLFFSQGKVYAALTFLAGDLLQVIVLVGSFIILASKKDV